MHNVPSDNVISVPEREAVLSVMSKLCRDTLPGREQAVKLAIIALLTGGHLLLEDRPGLGKTTLALALARSLGLDFGRVQCTSDLLPSDITGLSIFDQHSGHFRFIAGPIFHHVVLVDEINRAMPKTQSALLEAMEERKVTIEGTTHELPHPFLVIATQNPVEMTGTFPLPESQLDRFLFTSGLGYPPGEIETAIFQQGSLRTSLDTLQPLLSADQILKAQVSVRNDVHLSERVADYLYRLVDASRKHPQVVIGLSTRSGIGLADAARAHAWLEGCPYVKPEDVQAVAVAVGSHRLLLADEDGSRKGDLMRALLQRVPVPRE